MPQKTLPCLSIFYFVSYSPNLVLNRYCNYILYWVPIMVTSQVTMLATQGYHGIFAVFPQ